MPLAYLTVTNAFAALWLLPMSDRDKDVSLLRPNSTSHEALRQNRR